MSFWQFYVLFKMESGILLIGVGWTCGNPKAKNV